MKKFARDIILHMCTKNHNHMRYEVIWRYGVRQTGFFVIMDRFCPFTPYGPIKLKFWKNEKNTWRYYHFTNVYHKWQSYDIWFFRYRVQQTNFFCHFGPFFALLPPNNPKNQKFKKLKKAPGDVIILHKYTKNHDHMHVIDLVIIFHFGLFFTLLPP